MTSERPVTKDDLFKLLATYGYLWDGKTATMRKHGVMFRLAADNIRLERSLEEMRAKLDARHAEEHTPVG